jgi:flavin reductase (DIM6/NTAB) family NADH-FMN oxidoreductase RutF
MDPQSEVEVWLHGVGTPRDVTANNVAIAARPFTIGITTEEKWEPGVVERSRPSLKFRERGGERRLLGEIGLRLQDRIVVGGGEWLNLFRAEHYANYCLPRAALWRRYLHYSYGRWRSSARSNASDVRMVAHDVHSLFVFYICPRPVFLVSVADGDMGNVFPMDLVGPVGSRYFSLALHSTAPAELMERSRRIALCSIPVEQTSLTFELGKNHKKHHLAFDQLPFPTIKSTGFGLPIPAFSLRVRELEIELVRSMGSHKLFLARIVEEQRRADGLQMFQVHGFYQAWKQRAGVPHFGEQKATS